MASNLESLVLQIELQLYSAQRTAQEADIATGNKKRYRVSKLDRELEAIRRACDDAIATCEALLEDE